MIIDRTQTDVINASVIREEKVKKFLTLTEEEINILERGTITTNTINRILNKQIELQGLFNAAGYWNTALLVSVWQSGDLFKDVHFVNLLANVETLRFAFYVYKNTPETPAGWRHETKNISYKYTDMNDIEKILVDLENMLKVTKQNYRECGTFESGD